MGKPNIIGIVSHQSENGRLEKEKDSEVPLKSEREKLVDISFNRGTLLRTRPCSTKNIRIDQDFPKEKGDENKENLLGDDDATIVISSDEEEDAKKGNDEKRFDFEDLKRRAYQFLDQFFDKNPSMLAELKAKLEMEDLQKERDMRMGMATYRWMESQRKATEEESEGRQGADEGKGKVKCGTTARMYLRKCRLCGWSAISQKELDDHKSIHMQMDRTVKCLQCSMVFFDQRDLRAHEKAAHKSEFHCVYCDKQFRKAAYLEKHMIQHKMLTESHTPGPSSTKKETLLAATASVRKTFRCKVCMTSFKKKSSWKKHKKLHL